VEDIFRSFQTKQRTSSIVESLLHHLAVLRRIDVSQCVITAQGAKLLTEVLFKTLSLEELDISNVILVKDKNKIITESIKNLTSLKVFRMHNANFGEEVEVVAKIVATISQNKFLQKLDISYNWLSYTTVLQIITALSKIQFIESLDISGNPIGLGFIDSIAAYLANCLTLQNLNISHCLLCFDNVLKFARVLRGHPRLKTLSIYNEVSISFWSESEFLVDTILSINLSLTYLNVCGRNIRPRFIDGFLFSPKTHKISSLTNKFKLQNLYLSKYLLMRNITFPMKLTVSSFDGSIKVAESCPFVGDKLCCYVDHNGGTFYNPKLDLAIIVPPNAVSPGHCVEIKATASRYGPYEFPSDYSPISSFYWVSASYTFNVPVYLIMSHYASIKTLEDLNGLCVMQACVRDLCVTSEGKQVMKEVPKDSYYFDNEINYCVLATDHFCSFCMQKKSKQNIPMKFRAQFFTYDTKKACIGEVCFCPVNSDCIRVRI